MVLDIKSFMFPFFLRRKLSGYQILDSNQCFEMSIFPQQTKQARFELPKLELLRCNITSLVTT